MSRVLERASSPPTLGYNTRIISAVHAHASCRCQGNGAWMMIMPSMVLTDSPPSLRVHPAIGPWRSVFLVGGSREVATAAPTSRHYPPSSQGPPHQHLATVHDYPALYRIKPHRTSLHTYRASVPLRACVSDANPGRHAEDEGRRDPSSFPTGVASGTVAAPGFPEPPHGAAEQLSTPVRRRLTREEAESLFVAVVEAWSSLRCV